MRSGRRMGRLALLSLAMLTHVAAAQDKAMPFFAGETVHSYGVRDVEMVISRAGWHLMGRVPEGYRIGKGRTEGMTGDSAGALQACSETALLGHGAFERTFPAEEYAGKRVRVTGRVKLRGNANSTFYVNVIGPGGRTLRQISLPNSRDGNWQTQALVWTMEPSAIAIDIGVTLWNSAQSTVWLEGVTIQVVDESMPNAGATEVGGYERPLDDAVVSCDGLKDGVRN